MAQDDILFLSHLDDEGIDNDECSASELLVGSVRKLTILLSLPLYELLYPLIFKYIPSGVRRIGLGMVIAGLAAATIVVTDVAGHVMVPGNATMCHLINSTAEPIDIPVYWIILPYILSGIAEMLVFISGKKIFKFDGFLRFIVSEFNTLLHNEGEPGDEAIIIGNL